MSVLKEGIVSPGVQVVFTSGAFYKLFSSESPLIFAVGPKNKARMRNGNPCQDDASEVSILNHLQTKLDWFIFLMFLTRPHPEFSTVSVFR